MNTFNKTVAEQYINENNKMIDRKVMPVLPLNEVFEKYNIQKIDFLNIDAEGSDLDIVRSIDFENVDISYILIELFTDIDNYRNHPINILLNKRGYNLVAVYELTYIYKKN